MNRFLSLLIGLTIPFLHALSQESGNTGNAGTLIRNTTISGEWFLGFGYNDYTEISTFHLKRGYFTIRTKLNDMFSVRYTQDITTDVEGSDMGNVEMRLKYLLLDINFDKTTFLKNTHLELGLVHRPWLEYEQKLTGYRVQGKMFSDRYKLVSSADFGITYGGLLGEKMDEDYQERYGSYYPGRYGSFCIGIYNGGGYHALEENNNKIVEGRLTIRPLPDHLPGVQCTYTFSYGKSNTSSNESLYALNIFHIASISERHKLMLQYYSGKGGYNGQYINDEGISLANEGFSGFAELMIPKTSFSLFSRYDRLISHQETDINKQTFIAGLAYRFLRNKVLLNYDHSDSDGAITNIYEIALEINF